MATSLASLSTPTVSSWMMLKPEFSVNVADRRVIVELDLGADVDGLGVESPSPSVAVTST